MELYNASNDASNMKNDKLDNKDIYNNLLTKYTENVVKFTMYNLYKYEHVEETKKIVRNDRIFREDVIKRYNETCVITGSDISVCDVCHILPFAKCDDYEKYDVNNGLLLRKDLHSLFDKQEIKIDLDTCVIELSSRIIQNKKMSEYHRYNGIQIDINAKSIDYLKRIYASNE